MANSAITVSSLDHAAIVASLKSYMSSHPDFTDYDFDSSVLSFLIDVLAYNTYQNSFYAHMALNESTLPTARLRNSVVFRARDIGYSPRSARGARATIRVTIRPDDDPDVVTVAAGTAFTATVDGVDYTFVVEDSTDIQESGGEYVADLEVVEGTELTHRFTVSSENPVRYLLPNVGVDSSSVRVTVGGINHDPADDVTEVTSTSPVFFLFEAEDGQHEVMFGDGVVGRKPRNGEEVVVRYRVTAGTLANGAAEFDGPTDLGGYDDYDHSVVSAAAGGSDPEETDSIRRSAPLSFETQNRAVTDTDYERIVLREFPYVRSLRAWGGEENVPPIYGKVYLCVRPTGGLTLSRAQKEEIKSRIRKYQVMTVDLEFVDPSYLYVVPTITVRYDSRLTSDTAGQVKDAVAKAVVDFEEANLGTLDRDRFRFSKLVAAIDAAHDAIKSSVTTIRMQKRFVPVTGQSGNYSLPFNNVIRHPTEQGHVAHPGGHFVSSSAFTFAGKTCYLDDDGEGNIRIYHLVDGVRPNYLVHDAGTVDYDAGLVTLVNFRPTSVAGGELKVYAEPVMPDVAAYRNQVLLISDSTVTVIDESTGAVVVRTAGVTTSGVTSPVQETGTGPVVV